MHRYAQIRGGTPAHNMENEAAPGCSRLLLAAPGCPGCFWLLLAAAGCSWLPRESKSSPGGPNRAPGVQIKPWRSKSSPWRSKSSPGSQNGSSRLQADKKHHSGRVPGAGEILGNLGRYARYVQMCTDMLLKYVQVRTDTPDTYSYAQKRADTPDTCRHALNCSDTQRYARCAQIRQIRTDMLDTCRYVMIRQVRADAPDTCR